MSKGVLFVAGLTMISFGSNLTFEFFGNKNTPTIEEQLEEIAKTKNKSLPIMISDVIRFDKLSAKDKNLYYEYTLTNYSAGQVDPAKLKESIRENFKTNQCSNPNFLAYLKLGLSCYLNYSGNDGIPITSVVITSDHCEN